MDSGTKISSSSVWPVIFPDSTSKKDLAHIKEYQNQYQIKNIESVCTGKDTIRFIWFGDSGRRTDDRIWNSSVQPEDYLGLSLEIKIKI
jgi:hypothetical protein